MKKRNIIQKKIKKINHEVIQNHPVHHKAKIDLILREALQIIAVEVILLQAVAQVSVEADIQKIQTKKEEMKLFKIKKEKN